MSYSKIIHTKSEASGAVPAKGSLSYGEIAINYSDGHLYIKNADNEIKKVASSDFPNQISGLLTDVSNISNSLEFVNLQFISANDLIFGRSNINTTRANNSLTYGLSNIVGANSTLSSLFGTSNSAEGDRAVVIGDNNIGAGNDCVAVGSYVKTPTDVAEFGKWSITGVRTSSIRCANQNVSATLRNTSTSITDGGAGSGEEAAETLPYSMYSVRRHNDELLLDVNIDGTVKTCSIGTSTREQLGDDFTSKGIPIQNDRTDTLSITSVRHMTQATYNALGPNTDANTLYIIND